MNILFYITVSLVLIVSQTVIFPFFDFTLGCFDLILILVLHISLTYTHNFVILGLLLLGGIMDSISGVPFFYYVFSYLWIYFIVKLFQRFVFQRSLLFLWMISMVSILIQQGLMLFSVMLAQGQGALDWLIFGPHLVRQLVLGGVFLPLGVWLVDALQKKWAAEMESLRNRLTDRG